MSPGVEGWLSHARGLFWLNRKGSRGKPRAAPPESAPPGEAEGQACVRGRARGSEETLVADRRLAGEGVPIPGQGPGLPVFLWCSLL